MNTRQPFESGPRPPELERALARLRDDLAQHHAPPTLWSGIADSAAQPEPVWARMNLAASAAAGASAPTPRRSGGWTPGMGMVAVALLAVLMVAWVGVRTVGSPVRVPSAAVGTGPASAAPQEALALSSSGFVPVVSAERFAQLWPRGADAAPAWVVSTEIPREQLAALGLPFDPGRAGEPVRAELLMHPSGDVLAVRLAR